MMDGQVPWRCLVPADAVAFIIGKGGANIRQLCETSGAHVAVSKEGETPPTLADKVVSIAGFVDQKESACAQVVRKLRQLQAVNDNEPGVFVIIVPEKAAPIIIGTRGAQIKSIMEQSGAEINVGREAIIGMPDQPISINGTLDQVVSAVSKLNAVLQDMAERGNLSDRDFRYRPQDAGAGFEGAEGAVRLEDPAAAPAAPAARLVEPSPINGTPDVADHLVAHAYPGPRPVEPPAHQAPRYSGNNVANSTSGGSQNSGPAATSFAPTMAGGSGVSAPPQASERCGISLGPGGSSSAGGGGGTSFSSHGPTPTGLPESGGAVSFGQSGSGSGPNSFVPNGSTAFGGTGMPHAPMGPTSFGGGTMGGMGVRGIGTTSTMGGPAAMGSFIGMGGFGGMGNPVMGGMGMGHPMMGGMGMGNSMMASMQSNNERAFFSALQASGANNAQLTLLLPQPLVQNVLVPRGLMAHVAQRSGVQIDLGSEIPAGMRQVILSGSMVHNALASLLLQEKVIQCQQMGQQMY